MPICFARDRVCAISIARINLQMQYRDPKKLVFRWCLIQSRFGNMHPSSSRVYNKTCTILSNHYDNPKTREKNADLLCKRSSLRDFDRPPFLLWFRCVLNWLFTCIICAVINQCGLYVDKIKILKKISGCGLYTGALNRPKITVYIYRL